MSLFKEAPRPIYEMTVWPYRDRVVCHCTCNRCGEHFSMTLHANEHTLQGYLANEPLMKQLLINKAHAKHSCDEGSFKADKAETNRIVNKYHEYKIKIRKAFGEEGVK